MQQNIKEVYRYLRALSRYRYIATILALVVMTVIGGYSFTLPKQYQADSTVFIEKNVIDSLVKGIAVTPNINDKIRVLKYALSSRDLITKTLEEIDSEIFTKTNAEQQAYIAGLKERTKISVRGNDLFTVSLVGGDPAFIQKYINALVVKYVEESTSSKREEAYGASRFLSEQIDTFKEKLEKAEDVIIAFRKNQGIYFSVDEKSTVAEIKKYLTQIEGIELSLETLEAKKRQLQGQLKTLSPTIESIFSFDDGLAGIEGDPQLAAMENHLSNLRLRYTDNYPEIVRLKFEIEILRKRLQDQEEPVQDSEGSKMTSLNPLYLDVQQRLLEVQGELSSEQAKIKNLQRMLAKREKELHEVPANRKELNVLIEERNSYQKIYQDLLARMGKSEVSKQMQLAGRTATFRIVDPAVFPEAPISPNMLKMFLLAVAGGLGCAAGLVFLLENLDTRVRDVDVFKALGIEVLAIVPNISDPRDLWRKRKRDVLFFALTGVYGLCFVGLFAYEIYLR
ncbi:MAG: hypothetical protein GQ578_02395 [Desulfuromonadaceae bacterium]|nr:hypothetical protein [Desulfuromonadaceae bacterium]